jgi:soluble lytic murein transglycosylase-like protein
VYYLLKKQNNLEQTIEKNIALLKNKFGHMAGASAAVVVLVAVALTFAFLNVQGIQPAKPKTAVVETKKAETSVKKEEVKTVAEEPKKEEPKKEEPKKDVVPAQKLVPTETGLRAVAHQAATDAHINPALFKAQIQQESGFNPHAVSPAGAIGVAQIMPGTAAELGVNPRDPNSALHGAARLMSGNVKMFGGDYAKALAAYNAGPGAVQSAVASSGSNWLSQLPYETQHYVKTIMAKG